MPTMPPTCRRPTDIIQTLKRTNRPCSCENGHPSPSVQLLETSTVPFHPLLLPTTVEQCDAYLMIQHRSCSPRVQHQLGLCDRCSYRNRETQTSRLVFTARLRPQFQTPPVRNAPELRLLHAAGSISISHQASCCCSSAIAGVGANFKIYLFSQLCSNLVQILLQYTGDTDAKNDGPEF